MFCSYQLQTTARFLLRILTRSSAFLGLPDGISDLRIRPNEPGFRKLWENSSLLGDGNPRHEGTAVFEVVWHLGNTGYSHISDDHNRFPFAVRMQENLSKCSEGGFERKAQCHRSHSW